MTFPQRWCGEETLGPSRPVPSTRRNTSDQAHRLIFIQANLKQVSNPVVLNIFFHANKKKKKKVQFPAWVRFSCFRLATPAPLSPSDTHQRRVTHTYTHVLIKVSLHVATVTSCFFFLYIFLFFFCSSIFTVR